MSAPLADPKLRAIEDSIRLSMLREILEVLPPEMGGGEITKSIPDSTVLSGGIQIIKTILSELVKDYAITLVQNRELAAIAESAATIGKQQADDWDRFWDALGVKSADITVDQAIQKYKNLVNLLERCEEPVRFASKCASDDPADYVLLNDIQAALKDGHAHSHDHVHVNE